MVCDSLPSQDAYTHQIWNSYLKEYKRYVPDTIILKTRSEVKVKVTQKLYVALCHPKMHLHTKFGIPISKKIVDMHKTQCRFLETRSEVKCKVTVTQLLYATLCHPKMHLHTKFEIPTSNTMRDMLRTRLF